MKFFVISLERATKRREYISGLCERLGLDYELILAIDGELLSPLQIAAISNEQASLKAIGRRLEKGEFGCALSHLKIYEKMQQEQISECVIIEDDASFDASLLELLALKESFPKDLELLLLGHYLQTYSDDGFRIESAFSKWFDWPLGKWRLKRLVGGGFGTHGYYITQKGAQKLKAALQSIIYPIDRYTKNSDLVHVYALLPVVIQTHEHFGAQSFIQQNRQKIKKRSYLSKRFKALRAKLLYAIPSLLPLKAYHE